MILYQGYSLISVVFNADSWIRIQNIVNLHLVIYFRAYARRQNVKK